MAYLLIAVKTITSLLEGIFLKQYNAKKKQDSGFIFMSLISFCSMLFFVFTNKNGFHPDGTMLTYGIIGGALYCAGSFFTFLGLAWGSFAMSMLILSYGLVVSIGYGLFFLGEQLSVFAYIGLGLLLLSIFLVRSPRENEEKHKVTVRWLIAILIGALAGGFYSVVQRMQQIHYNDTRTNEFMIITLGISGIILLLTGLIKDRKVLKSVFKPNLLYAVGAGASNGVTNLLGLIVFTMIPISIASPLSAGAKIVISFLFSTFLFKEKFLKRQMIGTAVGTVALVLLNL